MADPQGRTFAARVSFDAGTLPVEVGQSARVYAPRGRGGELSVPMPALREHAGGQAVFVVDPATSKLVLRPVRIGRYDEATVPVLSGLRAGEWVVVAGVHLLREGQAVKPVDRDNRAVALAR
jgi:multidrug efflux system membrane fusion protein